MARLSHQLQYLAALGCAKLARLMNARQADVFGAGLGRLIYRIYGSRRKIAIDNIDRALGESLSHEQIANLTRQSFECISRTVIEFARFGKTTPDEVRRIVSGASSDMLAEATADGRGALVVTAHFGNWELLGSWLAAQGFETDIMVAQQHNPGVDRLITGFRESMGVGVIYASNPRQAMKALRDRRIVATGADQHSPGGNTSLEFFGRRAATPRGPALFAIRRNCPILPLLLRRVTHERHEVIAAPMILPPHSGDQEADIQSITRTYTGFFEDTIRRFPEQWMWTHRRWKLDDNISNP